MWLAHLGHFLGRILAIFFGTLGATSIGWVCDGLLAFCFFMIAWIETHPHGALRATVDRVAGKYSRARKFVPYVAVAIYGPIVIWSAGNAVYEDHLGLVARSASQRQTLQSIEHGQGAQEQIALTALQSKYNALMQERDEKDKSNQRRDLQLDKTSKAAEQTTTPKFLGVVNWDDSQGTAEADYLLLTNKAVETANLLVKCDSEFQDINLRSTEGNQRAETSNVQQDIPRTRRIQVNFSPTWDLTNPYIARVSYRWAKIPPRCNFQAQ